ncbi:MAG: leucine--tRNA ligase [Thermoplasmata archaeon]
MNDYDPVSIERKWQGKWEEDGVHRTDVDDDREPYYIIFAYPGISGFLHLGHMRSYTYTDIIARFKRMSGYNVLFPAGTHPTGNQAISLSKKIKEGDQGRISYLKQNGATDEDLKRMEDPMELVSYFNRVFREDFWKGFGLMIDFDHFTHTIREDYKQFIRWQFKKLKEKNLLTQKPYFAPECLNCGPVAVDPSETDLSKGGNAEEQEYTLLKFPYKDMYITAATLRPETVYGQTNLWVDPEEEYVIVEVGDEKWIMSEEAAEKLEYQKDDVEIVSTVNGEEMIGDTAEAPGIHRDIIILPADFTDPDMGTGIVTSVPSDAPYDWVALKDLKENDELLEEFDLKDKVQDIEPIEIIESKEWGTNPAEKIIEEMGIESQDEVEKLERATQEIYKAGFHTGKMMETCGEYEGMNVQEAKDMVKEDMIAAGEADVFFDLSEEVICRCGGKVIIGKIPDQWFIRYSDRELTEKSKEQARDMMIKPKTYSENLPGTLEWFQDRSCARLGNWLGTDFPFDDRWVIEAIADSTLYPAYYVLAKFYNQGKIKAEQMTEGFFDYVYQGEGDPGELSDELGIEEELLEEIKDTFDYWYPLDLNLGGKEHMTVHFPVFLMNHVAILNKEHWPQGIFVNWWLSMKGGKISKSKGGAEPIPDVTERFGVDTLRLYYAHSASPFVDKEWDEEEAMNYKKRLNSIWNLVHRMRDTEGNASGIDGYLRSRFTRLMLDFKDVMDAYEIRNGANLVFYSIPAEIEWYLRRGGENGELLDEIAGQYIRLIAAFTPHFSEELGTLWDEGYVTASLLPEADESSISKDAEAREEYIKEVMDDIRQILNIAKVEGSDIYIYVSPEWKETVLSEVMKNPEKGMGMMSDLVDKVDASPKEISSFLQGLLKTLREKGEKDTWKADIDEYEVLERASEFLEGEFDAEVHISKVSEEPYDPVGKSRQAAPRKPAIYVE